MILTLRLEFWDCCEPLLDVHARARTTCDYTKVLRLRLLRPQSDMDMDVALLLCQQSVFRPPLPPSQSNAEGLPCGSAHTYQAYHAAARPVHHGSCVGGKQQPESNKTASTPVHATHTRCESTVGKHSIPACTSCIHHTKGPYESTDRLRKDVCVCVCVCVCVIMTASRLPSLHKNHHTYSLLSLNTDVDAID